MVTLKSLGGVFAVRFSPFVNKSPCYLFSTAKLVIGDLFMLPRVYMLINLINSLG